MSIFDSTAFGTGTIVIAAIMVGIAFFASVMQVIGTWMTLQKMARHDFAALITGYSSWELARGAGASTMFSTVFVILFALSVVAGSYASNITGDVFIAQLHAYDAAVATSPDIFAMVSEACNHAYAQLAERVMSGDVLLIALMVAPLAYFVMYVRVMYGISKAFDHGVLFAVGLIVLPCIFFPVLGCAKSQVYQGPLMDADYLLNPKDDWQEVVAARIDTFGSNAPLALALIGMTLGGMFITVPGIVCCIIALVRNSPEKDKALAHGKSRATTIAAVSGIVISIAALVVTGLVITALAQALHLA